MGPAFEPGLGAVPLEGGRCRFRVWAPKVEGLSVRLLGTSPREVALGPGPGGVHEGIAEEAPPGTRYVLLLPGGRVLPDPASRYQPEGVHGPSEVVDPGAFSWSPWAGRPLGELVLYELHVGAFTAEGTFEAALAHLDALVELGITAVELMPVAEFPGERGWGYDGVAPFSVHHAYGGPAGLARFVDACHLRGLAVLLDVVHNHLGPEGSYVGELAPYYRRGRTPWGRALDFDAAPVRAFFIESALQLLEAYHLDGLRLDAVHVIPGRGPGSFLGALSAAVEALSARVGRPLHLIGEAPLPEPALLRPRDAGGCGLQAQWCDRLHHALHVLLTGERGGTYAPYGGLAPVAEAYADPGPLVAYVQNHDQVGNRHRGERLGHLVSFEALKLVAGALVLGPHLPLLFMGEEWAETAPFLFFTHYGDPRLVAAVRKGRKEDLAAFGFPGEPVDPQSPETFAVSKLHHDPRRGGEGAVLRGLYQALLRLRREVPSLGFGTPSLAVADVGADLVALDRGDGARVLLHFGAEAREVRTMLPAGRWRVALDSADRRWGGPGAAADAVLTGAARRVMAATSFLVLLRQVLRQVPPE